MTPLQAIGWRWTPPTLDPAWAGKDYWELEISPTNVVCDVRMVAPHPTVTSDLTWNHDGLETAVRHEKNADGTPKRWIATAFAPWAGFRSLPLPEKVALPPAAGETLGQVYQVRRPYLNLARTTAGGLDYEFSQRFGLAEYGKARLSLKGTRTLSHKVQNEEGQPEVETLGFYRKPRTKLQLSANWSLEDWSVTLSGMNLTPWRVGAGNFCPLAQGQDYYFNVKFTNPEQGTTTCSSDSPTCAVSLVNNVNVP